MRRALLAAVVLAYALPAMAKPAASAPRDATDQLPLTPARHIAFDTDEGTWMSLTLSPDGRTLVFDLLGDLYAMPAEGGTAHALTGGLPFDSQPAFSPDGRWIAFTSDRSGAENLWIMRPDGTGLRQLSHTDDVTEYVSPAWSPDSRLVYVSDYKPDLTAYRLWRYDLAGGAPVQVTQAKTTPDQPKDTRVSALGPTVSRDGRSLYYAEKTGTFDEDMTLPIWRIVRRDLNATATGTPAPAPVRDTRAPIDPAMPAPKSKAGDAAPSSDTAVPVVTAEGSAMRPVLSPDGRSLVYGTRWRGRTGLRVRDLRTGADRWLAWPVDRDDQEGLETRDTLPGSAFSPDGQFLYTTWGGHIHRVELATAAAALIPFSAHVDLDIGPSLRRDLRDDTGPVRARLIQTPHASPDGRQVAFSALAHIYVMPRVEGAAPRRLTPDETPAFMPSFSPDGAQVAYVTWTAKDGGAVWVASAASDRAPRRVGEAGFFYTNPVFAPDGQAIYVLRSGDYARMHTYMEYGATREADLVRLDLATGAARVVVHGAIGGEPQFVAGRPREVFINFDDGLYAVPLDGGARRKVVSATGPGFYFNEGRANADDIKISPDGRFALVQIAQQLHLIALPPSGVALDVDVDSPSVPHRKLTGVGADFFGWADGGRTILWALGSTVFTRPLASVKLDPPGPAPADGDRPQPGVGGVRAFAACVEVPRDVPHAVLLLTHAAAITEGPAGFMPDADILVRDDRIAALGPHGTVSAPAGATVRDLSGAYVIPGLIDTHDHWAQIRRGVLDLTDWGLRADLAYGKTAGLDPSTLTIDQFAYQDLLDAGAMLGPRTYSTGTAIFSFNEFSSLRQVEDVLTRYRDFYGTRNLKEYRTGPRRVRQWFVMASDKLGMQPTTEGALDMKLDLTQVMDGYAGAEHSMTAVPLYKDVRELMARTRVSYTLTLQISHGGPPAQNYYIARDRPLADLKMNRFWPPYALEQKASRRHWYDDSEYVFPSVAASAGAIQAEGGLLGTGSHGEDPGIGLDWEIEAYATGMGAGAALKAVTIGSAETIGRQGEIGSLEPGKFADLVILAADPRADITRLRTAIRQVMKGGRLYDAATLDELYPERRALPAPWFAADLPAGAAPAAPPLEAHAP